MSPDTNRPSIWQHHAVGEVVHEARWHAGLVIIVALVLQALLPTGLRLMPFWIVPALEILLLAALMIRAPHRRTDESPQLRLAAIGLIGIIGLANLGSLALVVHQLIQPDAAIGGRELLLSASAIWLTNILVFGVLYWEFDGGGPGRRAAQVGPHQSDLLFPQTTSPELALPGWKPRVVDYVYVSSTNAMAFSPTDAMPLTPAAKLIMLAQSITSLATIVLVAARAINILG